MYNEIITYYSKNPVNKGKLDDYTIEYFQDNRTCWEDMKIYIKIEDDLVKNWSFEWDISMITTACSSIFWESIILENINNVLKLDYNYIKSLIESEISPKRKNASVLWLLTTRNAIHKYLKDWILDDFDTVIN